MCSSSGKGSWCSHSWGWSVPGCYSDSVGLLPLCGHLPRDVLVPVCTAPCPAALPRVPARFNPLVLSDRGLRSWTLRCGISGDVSILQSPQRGPVSYTSFATIGLRGLDDAGSERNRKHTLARQRRCRRKMRATRRESQKRGHSSLRRNASLSYPRPPVCVRQFGPAVAHGRRDECYACPSVRGRDVTQHDGCG